jgi:hypothetical protein
MDDRPGTARAGQIALVRSVLLSAVAPWIVYLLLRPHVGSDAEALAIGGAVPAAWVLARLVITRRAEWLAMVFVAVFAVAAVVSLLSGGSALPFKLRYSVVTGAVGLACVISVIARRPLPLLLAHRSLFDAGRARKIEAAFSDPVRRHRLTVVTSMAGIALLLDAAVRAMLAVTLSTAMFLVASRVASWAVIGTGLAVVVVYLQFTASRPMRRPRKE